MKISQIHKPNKTQHELDFVDIDPLKDKAVFLDPFFISTRPQPWCVDSSRTIKSFFQYAIDLIKSDEVDKARALFVHLNEPNETCLGMSRSKPQGRGAGDDDSRRIFESILESRAVQTGLVEDLEDTAIFIDRIARDKVSDMTTNIIKKHLIDYTKSQCELWDIPLTNDVPSGFFWDSINKRWENMHTDRLVVKNKPLLLVPKIAVSFHKEYIDQKYYQHFALNYLQGEHLAKNSGLVRERTLKDGSKHRYVTKKDIKEKEAPFSKEFLREFTKNHPEVFKNFRKEKAQSVQPIGNDDLEDIDIGVLVDYLISSLNSLVAGGENASTYHKLIIGILEFIFYPSLNNPVKEKEINDGRKRIDITFDNSANGGFFHTLHNVHQITSRYIFVECKNYSEDPKNSEIDQLAGRFSVNTSKFGFLVCRTISDKNLFLKRCQDLWKQKNELIIPLTDQEIIAVLKNIKAGQVRTEEQLLNDLRRKVILS